MIEFVAAGLRRINLRGVVSLAAGASIAQALPVLAAPILSRLYAPEEFAGFAIFVALTNLGAIFATLKYEFAIILPEDDADAKGLLQLAGLLSFAVAAAIGLLAICAHASGHSLLGSFLPDAYLPLVVPTICTVGLQQVLFYWANRRAHYNQLATSRVVQAVTALVVSLGGAHARFGFNGLIVGNALGVLAACGFLGVAAHLRDSPFTRWSSYAHLRELAIRYRRFPGLTVPHTTMDSLQNNLVLYFLQHFFGGGAVGLFSFSFRVLKVPVGLIGSAISQVFYRDAAATYQRTRDIRHQLSATMLALAAVSIPVFALIMLLAPRLSTFAFGAAWADAGHVMQILAPWILLNFILSPVTQTPLIIDRQKAWFGITAGENVFIVLVILAGSLLGWSLTATLWTLSIGGSLYTAAMIYWLVAAAGERARTLTSEPVT